MDILDLHKLVFNLMEDIRLNLSNQKKIFVYGLRQQPQQKIKGGRFFIGNDSYLAVKISNESAKQNSTPTVYLSFYPNLKCDINIVYFKGSPNIKVYDSIAKNLNLKKSVQNNKVSYTAQLSNGADQNQLKNDVSNYIFYCYDPLILQLNTNGLLYDNQKFTDSIYYLQNNNLIYEDQQNSGYYKVNPQLQTSQTTQAKAVLTPSNQSINIKKLPLNLILYGPPGTGKTHCTVDKALERLLPKHELDSLNAITPKDDKRKAQEEKFNELKKQGRIVFTTFHQSMSYEDFIEGIKPETDDDGNVTYEVKPGIFKQLCEKAKLSQTSSNFNEAYNTFINDLTSAGYYGNNPSKFVTSNKSTFGISVNSKGNLSLFTGNPLKKQGTITKDNLELRFLGNSNYNYWESYFKRIIEHLEDRYQLQQENRPNNNNYVLIIDEINRGNVANIFGELITLIEDDKRLAPGKVNIYTVKLPYSNEEFGVPNNLYIIGTMNTADRSVEALDTALRRRFSFEEMMPRYDLKELKNEVCGRTLETILKTINNRLRVLKDREHQIGHSYFMGITTEEELKDVFFDKIIPLLQEYFYGDYEKILMVLGEGFVKTEKSGESIFAHSSDTYDQSDNFYHIKSKSEVVMKDALISMNILSTHKQNDISSPTNQVEESQKDSKNGE